ncbi:tyrosine-protein phosphatase siw14 [Elasticomyces elasticus]|nr:tyrosine-protein phosphatase siw14 [Elasticomyces elasticus]KAK4988839.1 tyrosine-protein phosphatase siw14 [Elasticomyces elasticus]KAK5002959.1 hypothetical protein LTR28_010768 [Elasticomyces elasticus]
MPFLSSFLRQDTFVLHPTAPSKKYEMKIAEIGPLEVKTVSDQSIMEANKNGATKKPNSGCKSVKGVECASTNVRAKARKELPCPPRLRMFIPPSNFGAVEPGCIYRSSYPDEPNFDFLRSIGIKTILTLVKEPLPDNYSRFILSNNIKHIQIHIPANKDGVINITSETMALALGVVLNRANQPLLVHCNRGKHRTGCLVACFRKVQRISLPVALSEYHDYANPKARPLDMEFVTSFNERCVFHLAKKHGWAKHDDTIVEKRVDSLELESALLTDNVHDGEEGSNHDKQHSPNSQALLQMATA